MIENDTLTILACQIKIPTEMMTPDKRDTHLSRTIKAIETQLDTRQADLVLLPELSTIDYSRTSFDRLEQLAEPLNGNSFLQFSKLAKTRKCHVLYGFARREANRFFITQALVGPDGSLVTYYDKIHLCHYGASMEKEYFTQGTNLCTFKLKEFTLAPIICYDIRIPELSRNLVLNHSADVILHSGAYYRDSSFATWHPFAVTRALENQIFLLSLNRAGENYGESILCYPWMDENTSPLKFPKCAEAFEFLTLDRARISQARETYTFLKDRQESYF